MGWINKAYQPVSANNEIFDSNNHIPQLGEPNYDSLYKFRDNQYVALIMASFC